MVQEQSYYNKPVRSLQTMLRSIAMTDDLYQDVLPDGVFGPETASAVSAFQQNQGLPATGIADQETWEQIVAKYDVASVYTGDAWPLQLNIGIDDTFQKGDTHPYIHLIQSMLVTISAAFHATSTPIITGTMDEATVTSLSEFQHLCGLPITGVVDKLTWKHLAIHYPAAVRYHVAMR